MKETFATTREYRIESVSKTGDGTVLAFPAAWAGQVRPGQFAMLSIPGFFLGRPLSIFDADPVNGTIAFLVKPQGAGSRALAGLAPGARVAINGPFGNSFTDFGPYKKVLLVAGGVGAAGLHLVAKDLAAKKIPTTLLAGFRSTTDVMGIEHFEKIDGLEIEVCTEDGSCGYEGRCTVGITPHRVAADVSVLACGPQPMLEAVTALSATAEKIFGSFEERMACGFGACMGCSVRDRLDNTHRVCKDGPIFDLRRFF